jgi:hypothetical protein
MASPLMLSSGFGGFGKVDVLAGAARSRSTSAGSSLSGSHESLTLQTPEKKENPPYPADSLGLPEYVYPMPLLGQQGPKLPEIDYPTPFEVKNTFIDFNVRQPLSLLEFLEERQTKSCPASGASGISLPPGLEDVIEPEQAAANLAAAEVADALQAMYHLPDGLLDAPAETSAPPDKRSVLDLSSFQSPQFWPSAAQPPSFDVEKIPQFWQSQPQQPHALELGSHQLHAENTCCSPIMQAPPLPLLLDSLLAPPLQAEQPAYAFDKQFGAQTLNAPPSWIAQPAQLGSLELPTVGSEGHHVGTCRPCAFLYTKGCANGVLCTFCHLCDAGEKKQRAKEKRAALKQVKQFGMLV